MERLTERIDNVPDGESGVWVKQHDYIAAAEKLADYEDAEEHGLLLRLPCRVGDTIYIVFYNHTIGERKVVSFIMIAEGWAVKTTDWIYLFTDFGETVFLTREKAKSKLKEMRRSHD